jgi:hypothetical protein
MAAATGVISGIPSATSSVATYTITASNASGSSNASITIQCVRVNNWTAANNTTTWASAGNWSANAIPDVNDNVQIGVIAYTKNKQPTISANTTVHSITFGSAKSGIVTLSSGVTLTIDSDITVNASSSATLKGGAASSTVAMVPGSIVNVANTGTLTLTSPVTFLLESDATGDAAIGQISAGAITGSVSVQRYLTGGSSVYRGYRLLSSPVYNSTINGNVYSINYLKNSIYLTATTTTGGFDNTSPANPTLYLYRESLTPSYTSFTGSNFRGINDITASPTYTLDGDGSGYSIPAGNGILCFFRGDRSATTFANETVPTYVPQPATLTTTGTLNIGQVTVRHWYTSLTNLSYTAGSPASVRGYNLVGNPYASAIDWDTFQSSSTSTGIYGSSVGATIYVLDPISHNYGAYISGNGGFAGTNNATNIISSGQAFFVVASSSSAQLIFNESAKTTTVNTGTNLLMGTPVNYANNQYLKLRLAKDASNADETTIRFSSQGNLNFNEVVDALYKPGYGSVSLSGISSDLFNLAIDVIPLPKLRPNAVGLNVNASADGTYSLTLKDIVAVPRLYDVWLIDKFKHDSLDMRQNKTYLFNIVKKDTATYGASRFAVIIRQNPDYAYRLQNFTARKDSAFRHVQIAWNTVNEGNYTNFTVERSTDNGKTFNVLGGVAAAGQGSYSLIDKSPQSGLNLYRLKSEDINNVITYSNIVTIEYAPLAGDLASNKLIAYPNPVTGNTLSLAVNAAVANNISSFDFRFMNSSGLVIREITSSQPSWQGSIGNLQPGTYIVQVRNAKDETLVGQTKFVKL